MCRNVLSSMLESTNSADFYASMLINEFNINQYGDVPSMLHRTVLRSCPLSTFRAMSGPIMPSENPQCAYLGWSMCIWLSIYYFETPPPLES